MAWYRATVIKWSLVLIHAMHGIGPALLLALRSVLICFAVCLSVSGCGALLFGTMAGSSVVYLMQERSAGVLVDDFTTWAAVRNKLIQCGGGDFVDVNVDVVEGRVMLTGMVKTPQQRLTAAKAAWEQDGVREVINEIQLYGTKKYAVVYAHDVSMNSQIKARLLMTKNIRSINYSVETVDGVAYLFGTAHDRDELENVTDLVSRVKGVKKVVAHVRLRKDLKRTLTSVKSQEADLVEQDTISDLNTSNDLWDW